MDLGPMNPMLLYARLVRVVHVAQILSRAKPMNQCYKIMRIVIFLTSQGSASGRDRIM